MNKKIKTTKDTRSITACSIGGIVLRSSNYKHSKNTPERKMYKYAKPKKKTKRISKLSSIIVSAFIVFGVVIIPSVTYIQDVEAVTEIRNYIVDVTECLTTQSDNKAEKNVVEKNTDETQKPTKPVEPETSKPVKNEDNDSNNGEADKTEDESLVDSEKTDISYEPKHISLSSYDREKLERLVMGEAGGLGYTGAALVAQTIRDTMELENTSSIDYIINSYQYEGSTEGEATNDVKNAVSYIFDEDGYAVRHRILYFYASDITKSEWHETQQFITSCGSERFFDRW